MSIFKLDLLLLIAIPIALGAGLVWINTAGVVLLSEATHSPKETAYALQAPNNQAQQPGQAPAPDVNANVWTALISLLVLYFFNFVHNLFSTWLQYKLKRDVKENTEITKQIANK